ncbi:Alpha/Beta hydrolase protein [Xylariaceae sp. FL1272]|nr:Alpha/Beta hydrolase protein [Xylariaceae sp. FL1272]
MCQATTFTDEPSAKRAPDEDRAAHQPIHPDIRSKLDPEYVAFHDKYFQFVVPDNQKAWDGSARTPPSWIPPTGLKPVPVGSVEDIELENFTIRVFTPDSPRPERGWPVFLWFHGGGWAVGDITMGNDLCSLICQRASCVVITVGYRLAPEHQFPAAVDDAIAALEWVCGDEAASKLNVDKSRVAIGGTSAGGHLSAVLAMKAAQMQPPRRLEFQVLVVPVIDNTATVDGIWSLNKNAPWLTPARMTWYRRMFFPDEELTKSWEGSPHLAPLDLLAKTPKTLIAVAEQDLLEPEGRDFGKKLENAWTAAGITDREVSLESYEGSTHSILSMAGVLNRGRQLIEDVADQAATWFGKE